jgi:hypothetical protein
MRFQEQFSRVVAATGTTTLGTDAVPTSRADTMTECYFSSQIKNIDGFPVQRFCVAYKGPTAATDLPAQLYVWDDLTGAWYASGASQALHPGTITWFDQPSLGRVGPADQTPGSLDLYLHVAASGGTDPDGTYTFALGADLSNNGAAEVTVSVGTPRAITPSNTTDTTRLTTRGIAVITTGNLVVVPIGGGTAQTYAVVSGQYFPFNVLHINASTTAVVAGIS